MEADQQYKHTIAATMAMIAGDTRHLMGLIFRWNVAHFFVLCLILWRVW